VVVRQVRRVECAGDENANDGIATIDGCSRKSMHRRTVRAWAFMPAEEDFEPVGMDVRTKPRVVRLSTRTSDARIASLQ
jgi:hypothetical protein